MRRIQTMENNEERKSIPIVWFAAHFEIEIEKYSKRSATSFFFPDVTDEAHPWDSAMSRESLNPV